MSVRVLSKGETTRERLLDLAEKAVLQKGFAATTIDELIAQADITKSGFFYHFRDKNDLAKALLKRYLERDDVIFDDLFAKADALNEDPLHGFLVFLDLAAAAAQSEDRAREPDRAAEADRTGESARGETDDRAALASAPDAAWWKPRPGELTR